MQRPVRILLLVSGLLLVFGTDAPTLVRAEEHSYGGRPLSSWLKTLDGGKLEDFAFPYFWGLESGSETFKALENLGAEAVPGLAEKLGDANPVVRYNAAVALGRIGPEARGAVPELVKLLLQGDLRIRIMTVEALEKIGVDAAPGLPALVPLMASDEFVPIPPHATWSLSEFSSKAALRMGPEALPFFLKNVTHLDADVRIQSLDRLAELRLHVWKILPVAVKALEDENRYVRAAAAETIGKLRTHDQFASRALLRHLDDVDGEEDFGWSTPTVAAASISALNEMGMGDKDVLALKQFLEKPLPEGLKSPEKEQRLQVRLMVIDALGAVGPRAKPALSAIESLLNQEDTRHHAAAALLSIDRTKTRVAPVVRESVSSENERDSIRAIRAFKHRERDKLIEAVLHDALRHESRHVRVVAAAALLWLDSDAVARDAVLTLLRDGSFEEEWHGYTNAIELPSWPEWVQLLEERSMAEAFIASSLRDEDLDEWRLENRLAAVSALGPHGRLLLPRIRTWLKARDDVQRRRSAAVLLGALGQHARSEVPLLVKALKDPRVVVRAAAADALGHVGDSSADVLQGLSSLCRDDYATVRCAAAASLGRLGPAAKSVLPTLLALSKDSSSAVRESADLAVEWLTTEID